MTDALELSDLIVDARDKGTSYQAALREFEKSMVPRAAARVQGSRDAWDDADSRFSNPFGKGPNVEIHSRGEV